MNRWTRWAALLTTFMIAAPVLAQDAASGEAPAGDQVTSWAKMFLYSDDLIGNLITWTLLLMSAMSIGYSLKLFMAYRRNSIIPDDTSVQIESLLNEKRYREAIEYADADHSYLGKLVSAALNEAGAGYGAMERAVEEASDAEVSRALRPVEYLNVLGNIAPMLGLFGTVYGMIVAFQKLVAAGGKPDPGELAAGISTALVTTFWGLVVAIPALAAYAIVRNKIDALTSEGMLVAEELIRPFKPGARKTAAPASAAPAAKPAPKAAPKPEGENQA